MIRSENKEGQMVVVHIDDAGKQSGWFVGMIMREVSGGYFVRVSFPREYRRPVHEPPKRKWYTKASATTKDEDHEGDFQSAWCGWVESPQDPLFVLFARIASPYFLNDLRRRLERKGVSSDAARDCVVPARQILPLNPQKLYQAIFA
jgi:hypothetical protein